MEKRLEKTVRERNSEVRRRGSSRESSRGRNREMREKRESDRGRGKKEGEGEEREGKMRRGRIVLVSIYPPKERVVKPVRVYLRLL